ncbi:MAG: GyrI-like domain-containing protein [Bacillota bacterium]
MSGVGVKVLPPERVAYLVRKGEYNALAVAFRDLAAWVREKGLEPAGPPVLVYLSNPGGVPPAFREWELQIPVAGEAVPNEGEAGTGIKEVAGREVVFTTSRGGYTTIEILLPALFQALYDRGYRLAGPAEEVYPPDFPEVQMEKMATEVRFPVVARKKQQ